MRNSLVLGIAIGLLASAVFVSGFTAGTVFTRAQSPGLSMSDKDLKDFLSAYHLVTQRSYNQHLDHRRLLYAAIDGMLSATGDPHTIFLSPDQNRAASSQINGSQYGGIGAIVVKSKGALRILAPLPHTPSARAGLQDGDLVTSIDGRSVSGMTGDVALARIHGRAGSAVHLAIVRAGHRIDVIVTRAFIPPVTAYGHRLQHHLSYVQIFSFGSSTAGEVADALTSARKLGAHGVVLDLRGNPGGYVDAAQRIVSRFIGQGVVAYEQRGDGSLRPLDVLRHQTLIHVPVAVLVDSGTASAAEITAAALRDEDHAVLIGSRTYGKGSMQSVYTLSDGSSVRITDRLWLTPKKRSIQRIGLVPDLTIPVATSRHAGTDPQLAAAERYLLKHVAR